MKKLRALLFFPVVILLSACSFSLAEDITPPPNYQPTELPSTQIAPAGALFPVAAPDPQAGQAIYAEKCAPCHGETGLGDGSQAAQLSNPVPALGSAELARQASPAEWYQVVTQGRMDRFMPPFTSLTDSERWDVVAYALSLSAGETALARGEELYQANCAVCHGDTGLGDGPNAESLTVSPTNFTDQKGMAAKSTSELAQVIRTGAAPAMPAFAQLSEEDVWALSDYIRSLSFAEPGQLVASPPDSTAGAAATPLVGATPLAAVPVEEGVVSGQVTNASGGAVPESASVVLRGFDEMQEVITETAALASDGSFRFENIEMPAGRVFLATVDYKGTTYGSDISEVEAEQREINLPISIYDSTTDSSILVTDRLHLFFEFVDEQTLRIIQLYIISNPTSMTLVSEDPTTPTVNFALPEGAANLEIQDGVIGERFVQTEDGFGDTTAIRPGSGSYQVLYAYELPYKNKLELVQPLTIPTSAVVILVPEGVINIKGERVEDAGVRDVEGTQYRMYNLVGLNAGADLRLTVSGKMAGSGLSLITGDSSSLLIGVGVFGVVLLAAGGWLFMRDRARTDEEAEQDAAAVENAPAVVESRETLMDAILALDDLYQEGHLPKDAYQERRAALKARLRDLEG
ncbi:MAG TPA: c-type cytochrome [Anaerolineales bacterium]|nr:c-type cytochrome [Anaerolineales bacterium]